MTRPKALLFDLGGVVIEVDMQRSFDHWGDRTGTDVSKIAERHLRDEVHDQYERGEIPTEAYMDHLRQLMELDLSHTEMVDGWNALLVQEIVGIRAVLQRLSGAVPLYAFSNTNAAHVESMSVRFGDALNHFDTVYVSSSIGHRKPELKSFLHVADAMGFPPEEILFFDDSPVNLDGARKAGLQTVHVRSHDDVLAALSQHGF
ncbi:HAD family hydrolase [Hwanghaeella grinnelliae]|nr:HAD family phosphatase [Hwanghaeella grinnelliae]